MLRQLVELLVLPPASGLLLFLLGTLLLWRQRRLGRALQITAFVWLWATAMPCTGGLLLAALQGKPLPAEGPLPPAQAIVVLSAEADRQGSEYGAAVAGPTTMQRLRYGAFLQRRTGLPMLVSGGIPALGQPSLAALMARAAQQEFAVPVRWREEKSATTLENARFSAVMLQASGMHSVLLVTSAWHMPRAAACFRAAGLTVVEAPTAFRGPAIEDWSSFVPRSSGLRDTCLALHEFGGRLFYWL